LAVLPPVEKTKGATHLETQEQCLFTAIARVRQPIEALFVWIEEKTGIKCVSQVRSYKGLMGHIKDLWCIDLENWLRFCFSGIF
jgi:hypothetical protein